MNDDLVNQLKKNIRKFHQELEKKIGLDQETEELIGIRFEDIGKVYGLKKRDNLCLMIFCSKQP